MPMKRKAPQRGKERPASARDWFKIRAQSEARAELSIFGDIGEDWLAEESNTAKNVVERLAALGEVTDLDVRINSYGGSVADGLAIYNALKRHPANVAVTVEGVAVSIASLIAMAGDSIEMPANTLMMVHAPWGLAMGNAPEMREMADVLDKYAEAMASSYAGKTGRPHEEMLALLSDGEDHWFTAAEAVEAGFADYMTEELAAAASLRMHRFSIPAATAAQLKEDNHMATSNKPNVATPADQKNPEPQVADTPNVTEIEKAAEARFREQIQARNNEIKARFQKHLHKDGVQALYNDLIGSTDIDVDAASARLLDHLGKDAEPLNPQDSSPRIEHMLSDRDKFRAGAGKVLAYRMGIGQDERTNELRGSSLSDLARHALALAGHDVRGMTRPEIAGRVLAMHTTSDFPLLLADAANKRLQAAYEAFPQTFRSWCMLSEVPDFKANSRIRMGAFNSLETIPEGAEYTAGTIGEEREQITAATKGKFIQLTRTMIVNDDLNGFNRMAQMLGSAAARTVNADAYGVLNTNGNMSDGTALFHADHGNLAGSAAAISVATLSSARAAMRKQTPPGDTTEYLNIMPRYLLVPVVLEDSANEIVTSTTNITGTNSARKNPIRDWGPLELISDPALDSNSATAFYLVADPMQVPLVEVAFLDGNQVPFVSSEEEFLTDSIRWKVRLDYGVAANDYRAGYKNAGA